MIEGSMRRYPTTRMPYEPVFVKGNTLSIDVAAAKRLILFTGHEDKLAGHNEYALDPRIQTGFGIGINDSAMPFENGVGTLRLLNDPIDNVWLTKIDGSGKNKVFTSGYLQANNHLSVDTTNHTITEEFVVRNNGPGTDVQVIDACDSAEGWSAYLGTMSFDVVPEGLVATGTSNGNSFVAKKTITCDLSTVDFLTFDMKGSVAGGYLYVWIVSSNGNIVWNSARNLVSTTKTRYILPLRAPKGSTTVLPLSRTDGVTLNDVKSIYFGISGGIETGIAFSFNIGNITACNGTWAQVEVAIPDMPLYGYSVDAQSFNVNTSSYIRNSIYFDALGKSSPIYEKYTSNTNMYSMDGTKFSDIYGSSATGAYRANHEGIDGFTVGGKGDTRTGCFYRSPNTITYSSNYGTSKRIGLAILMPPSDNGRTGINQCRLKLVTYYDQLGETTHEFSKDLDYSTGIDLIKKPFFAFYDPVGRNVEYYILTKKPLGGSYKFNETGNISNITFQLDANTRVYRGQHKHVNLTRDSDADTIPDFLDSNEVVSIEHLIGHLNFIE